MGFSKDPTTGKPIVAGDADDLQATWQAIADFALLVGGKAVQTYTELLALESPFPGLRKLVATEGTEYTYFSDTVGWVPTGGKLPYVEDTRTSNMLVGTDVDHNVITITLPRAGRWQVEAQASFESNALGSRRSVLKVDGSIVTVRRVLASSTSGSSMNISDIVSVSHGGATLAFNVFHTGAAPILQLPADPFLWKIALRAQYLSAL